MLEYLVFALMLEYLVFALMLETNSFQVHINWKEEKISFIKEGIKQIWGVNIKFQYHVWKMFTI